MRQLREELAADEERYWIAFAREYQASLEKTVEIPSEQGGQDTMRGNLVRLRFPEPADHRSLVKWRNENLRYFFSDEPVSLENHLDWYEQVSHDASQRFFVVEHESVQVVTDVDGPSYFPREFSEPVGTIGLANIDFRHRRAEYGRFLIAEEHRGKGYGKDALSTLLKLAFVTLGLHKVYGEILTRNTGALDLCQSLGFLQEGDLHDHVFKEGRFWDVTRVSILAAEFGGTDK